MIDNDAKMELSFTSFVVNDMNNEMTVKNIKIITLIVV